MSAGQKEPPIIGTVLRREKRLPGDGVFVPCSSGAKEIQKTPLCRRVTSLQRIIIRQGKTQHI